MLLNVVTFGDPTADAAARRVPLVAMHGLFGRARNLATVLRGVAAGRRTVGLDLRSHGDSPHGPLAIPAMARDVAETLDRLGIGRAVLLGHSLGGKVAMAAALSEPGRVARLLVADIAPVAYGHGNGAIAAALASLPLQAIGSRAAADAALADAIPDAGLRAFLLQNLDTRPPTRWRIGLADILASIAEAESWPCFPPGTAYGGDALFVRGDRSRYVLPEHRPTIRSLFPRARFATLRHAGHWLHADQPDAFASLAAGFADGADPERDTGRRD